MVSSAAGCWEVVAADGLVGRALLPARRCESAARPSGPLAAQLCSLQQEFANKLESLLASSMAESRAGRGNHRGVPRPAWLLGDHPMETSSYSYCRHDTCCCTTHG